MISGFRVVSKLFVGGFFMCVSGLGWFGGGLIELCFSCVIVGLWLFLVVVWQ